jgi:hypothetical protein
MPLIPLFLKLTVPLDQPLKVLLVDGVFCPALKFLISRVTNRILRITNNVLRGAITLGDYAPLRDDAMK